VAPLYYAPTGLKEREVPSGRAPPYPIICKAYGLLLSTSILVITEPFCKIETGTLLKAHNKIPTILDSAVLRKAC
jgi:hypothetical protein